jgi:HTH-type transcriptional regulator / antitoxin HigA
MDVKPIKSPEDYQTALAGLEAIWEAEPGTPESDELDVPAILVDAYEEEHFPIDPPDPIEAIKFRMEQMGLEDTDLESAIGPPEKVSEVLSRRIGLDLDMIRKLNQRLGIPAEILIAGYSLDSHRESPGRI